MIDPTTVRLAEDFADNTTWLLRQAIGVNKRDRERAEAQAKRNAGVARDSYETALRAADKWRENSSHNLILSKAHKAAARDFLKLTPEQFAQVKPYGEAWIKKRKDLHKARIREEHPVWAAWADGKEFE